MSTDAGGVSASNDGLGLAPKRAYRLTLELGADTAADMAWALRNLAHRIERGEVTQGVWGGPSDGAIYELLIDPTQTHEKFFAELNAYLERKDREKRLDELRRLGNGAGNMHAHLAGEA